jgi:hypothetical protein
LKQLQKVLGKTLELTGLGYDFLNRNPMAQHLRERMNKWDSTKLRCFSFAKEIVNRLNSFPQNVRKSLPAIYPIRY